MFNDLVNYLLRFIFADTAFLLGGAAPSDLFYSNPSARGVFTNLNPFVAFDGDN